MEIVDIFLETIDSTNNYAKKNYSSFDQDKITCITAEEQTTGKGRFNRTWVSPKGMNIYTTFYFRLPAASLHLSSLAQIMTLSLCTLLIKENIKPEIKWPNDILLNNKKVSGVLCETVFNQNFIDIFLGIGINVNMDENSLKEISPPATSLKMQTNFTWDRKDLLKKLQQQFISDLEKFKKDGFTPFHCQFENLLAFKGEKIVCYIGKEKIEGILHSVTCDGQLNLYLPNKEIKTISSADITSKETTN